MKLLTFFRVILLAFLDPTDPNPLTLSNPFPIRIQNTAIGSDFMFANQDTKLELSVGSRYGLIGKFSLSFGLVIADIPTSVAEP
jgi:hypothetical protein